MGYAKKKKKNNICVWNKIFFNIISFVDFKISAADVFFKSASVTKRTAVP